MISVQEAKRLSLIKWNGELHGIEYKSEVEKIEPAISGYFHCGFCLRHGYDYYGRNVDSCIPCEVKASPALGCCDDNSLYGQIEMFDSLDEKKPFIKEFIEIIKNIPDE